MVNTSVHIEFEYDMPHFSSVETLKSPKWMEATAIINTIT